MSTFTLGRSPSITSAIGAIARLPTLLQEHDRAGAVLVIFDLALASAGVVNRVMDTLSTAGIHGRAVMLPAGEPSEAMVRATLKPLLNDPPQAIVCVGGGSVMDAGKLIACLCHGGDDISAYRLAARALPKRQALLVCMPTTAGTGAEATTTSVIAQDDGIKNWFWHDGLKPDLVVLDPELTVALPAQFTAETGMDALVHAIEAATNANATDANNMFALRAIGLVERYLLRAVQDGADLEARSGMQEAALLAGLAIDNAGTAVAHNIGHALGSLAQVRHGRAVTIGMCASMDWCMDGHESAYEGVASAMKVDSAQLSRTFAQLALRAGVSFALDASLTPDALRAQMMQPENIAMARSNRREVHEDDFTLLAKYTLDLTTHPPLAAAV
jgi:alcohol dehydrogenase class IV